MDAEGLAAAARAAGRRIVVVEDHYPEGGLGEAVLAALSPLDETFRVEHLAVRGLPGSGTPAELMAAAGIRHDVEARRCACSRAEARGRRAASRSLRLRAGRQPARARYLTFRSAVFARTCWLPAQSVDVATSR